MNDKMIKSIKIGLATILLIVVVIIDKATKAPNIVNLAMYLVPYLIVGFDVLKEAIEGIKEKEIFNENFLMSIATIGALLIGFLPNSEPEYVEAVFVMLFFGLGELFEMIAEGNSIKSINSLLEIRPDYANIIKNKKQVKVDPNDVKVGDIIVINPGEKVPLDGEIIEGKSTLNTVALTGESVSRSIGEGEVIISGCVNLTGSIKVRVTKVFSESTANKIIELVTNAQNNKSTSDKFITKFSKVYTPFVVISAFLLAIIPSIITGDYVTWISRALTFLVVSCPCALVISIPLTYFGGIGGAAKKGVLIKGSNYLEGLSKVKTVVFDKTGTLTEGVFEVVAVHPKRFNKEELLHLAFHVESYSTHPIAVSLKEAHHQDGETDDDCEIKNVEEMTGMGVKANINNEDIYVGSSKLMDKLGIEYTECHRNGSIVHISTNMVYLGHIVISDKIKDDSKSTISDLKARGIKTIMLSGDKDKHVKYVSDELMMDKYYAELMPKDKVDIIEQTIKETKGPVAFVGDGINDAPVLARCDIGIAMGSMGSDAAIEASNVVLMNDKISNVTEAIKLSKKTQRIAVQNIVLALAIKFLVLILALFGYAPMWLAVFADVGVTIIAILNAMRTLSF